MTCVYNGVGPLINNNFKRSIIYFKTCDGTKKKKKKRKINL